MSTDLDRTVEEIEQQIIEQAREIYSDKVVNEFYNPHNVGRIHEPNAHGLVHGWCGDTMEITLRLKEERIEAARFTTDGCGPTVACGSMLTRMVQGMSLAEASRVQPDDLLQALDGLPKENVHCAELAVKTLQNALLNWHAERNGLVHG